VGCGDRSCLTKRPGQGILRSRCVNLTTPCAEVGRDSARHIERMTNSGLQLNPGYAAARAEYLKGVGGKK
jgi:hypothetical protein